RLRGGNGSGPQRCHPHALLLLLLLAAALAGAPPGGLYSPGDPLVLLQVDTLESSVLNSSSAWLVEFYASWCGHCVHFAPTWRALAADIQEWSPAVNLGVLDCADIANQKMCGKFGITGFPTVQLAIPEEGVSLEFEPGLWDQLLYEMGSVPPSTGFTVALGPQSKGAPACSSLPPTLSCGVRNLMLPSTGAP
uniref:Thioredoxin domain-containing protein n=1 Tax=Gopherus evgoodei TaxID=1825980 RepID=A0A8C4WB80_9SAUR